MPSIITVFVLSSVNSVPVAIYFGAWSGISKSWKEIIFIPHYPNGNEQFLIKKTMSPKITKYICIKERKNRTTKSYPKMARN